MANTVKSVTAKKISSINTFFDGEIKKPSWNRLPFANLVGPSMEMEGGPFSCPL
jgi:hypothetical protein